MADSTETDVPHVPPVDHAARELGWVLLYALLSLVVLGGVTKADGQKRSSPDTAGDDARLKRRHEGAMDRVDHLFGGGDGSAEGARQVARAAKRPRASAGEKRMAISFRCLSLCFRCRSVLNNR